MNKLRLVIVVMLLISSIKSFSQDSKFSIELNYPILIDDNFIGENYNGIIDVGIGYDITNLNSINLGISVNGGVLVNNSNQNNGLQDFKITSYVVQPRVFGELNLESLDKFHPSVGLGYTVMAFSASGTNNGFDVSDQSDTQSGFNFNFGIAYDINDRLVAKAQYDFVKLGVDSNVPDIKFNTNVNILKIGLGYKL